MPNCGNFGLISTRLSMQSADVVAPFVNVSFASSWTEFASREVPNEHTRRSSFV